MGRGGYSYYKAIGKTLTLLHQFRHRDCCDLDHSEDRQDRTDDRASAAALGLGVSASRGHMGRRRGQCFDDLPLDNKFVLSRFYGVDAFEGILLVDDFPLRLSHSFTGISERGFVVDNRLLGGGEVVVRGGEVVDKRSLRSVSCDLEGPSTTPMAEAPFTEGTELYEAWSATPSGMLFMNQQLIDEANAAATTSCASSDAKELDFPTAPIALDKTKPGDMKDAPNVAAIVGGVIAALLALAGIAAALPMLRIKVPGM